MKPSVFDLMLRGSRDVFRLERHDTVLELYPGGMQGVVDVQAFCRKCHERWHLAGVNMGAPSDRMREIMDAIHPCRGEPLYTAIEGTPWFTYAARKEHRK
jgi:hypothetical protein